MSEILFSAAAPGLFVQETARNQKFSMVTRHFHESYELYFLLEGQRFYFIQQDTYIVKAGMAVLINRNQIHKTSAFGNPSGDGHRRFLLQLDASVFDPILTAMGCQNLSELGNTHWGVVRFLPHEWEQCQFLIAAVKEELGRPGENSRFLAYAYAASLLLLYCRSRKRMEQELWKQPDSSRFQAQTGMYRKIHEIAQFLQNSSGSKESLDELAKRFYLSKSYLTRSFKAVTGFTINEYQNMARIKKAQTLLVRTSLSVSEIAEQTGFSTAAYFIRNFKKTTGVTPLTYRKNHNPKIAVDKP